jgi:diguanylate cyclase (GGDEF)-like protein/PAS domain S-box-containing protein
VGAVEVLLLAGLGACGAYVVLHRRLRRGEEAIAALRANEERFRHLTALSADWFWETDAGHRVTWLSGGPTVLALFGEAPVSGRQLWEVPGVRADPGQIAAQLERRVPFFDFEIVREQGPQARQIHLVAGQPRFDARGEFAGYRGVGRDVTEKRISELALGEAKERLELAAEGGNLAVWDVDLATDAIYLSEGWAKLLGGEALSRTARSAELLELVHPKDREGVRAAFVRAARGEAEAYSVDYRVRTAKGDWKWVHSSGRVTQRDADGRARRMSGAVADIDARKRAEQATRDAEARYRSLIELAPDGVIVHSGGVVEYANAAAARLLHAGVARRLVGMRMEDLIHPDHLARFRERHRYHMLGPGTTRFEERKLRCLDGASVTVEAASVSYLERGRLVVQGVFRDVSEQRNAQAALAERERRFRDVVEAAGEYVWETDAAWRYTYLSERAESVLGYLRSEMLGRTPREFMPLGEARHVEEWFARRAERGEPFRDLVHRSITKSGRVIWQSVSGVPVHDASGRLAGYRGTGSDVTARKQAEERIQFLATRDALTGLPNRVLLADRAGQAVLAAARSQGRLAVICLDLDRFKLVNDSLGHQAGDALLRAVAERLGNTLRRDDTLARLGGDEFALLWNGLKDADGAALVAQRMLAILARPFTVEGRTLAVTASAGVAVYPEDGRDFAELLRNADAAMFHAKDTGRNGFRFFSPELHARAAARLALENDLRGAMARGELVLHYQPVVRAGGAPRVVGAEVLARWRHPREGLLMPDAFIPVAEECGLIRPLGRWMLERAISQIGAWRGRLGADLWFSINTSASELAQGEAYVAQLGNALAASEVPGRAIELEVTERVLMSNLAANIETLQRIGALGVRVAIDDFGTGYSSLAYLRRLPIDKLKIDRSFLRELDVNRDDQTLVRTITAMAQALGLHVAAEGVESAAQLARLVELGCEEWQGHHFSAPLEASAFEALVAGVGIRERA